MHVLIYFIIHVMNCDALQKVILLSFLFIFCRERMASEFIALLICINTKDDLNKRNLFN